jgi:hypothetical protein
MQIYILFTFMILIVSIPLAEAVSHLMQGEPVLQDTSSDNAIWLAGLNKAWP